MPEANGGGATRNGDPLYDIPAKRMLHHLVTEAPVRTSALRGLGAMPNVFALECCIDELAERAGQDPVQYRLSITADTRARAVIEKVAAMAKWNPGAAGGSGRGRGIAFARYKNRAAYSAVVVELSVEEEIRLHHVWCATDAGLVVNPDGAINQLEGGIIQSASWVLKEQVRFDNGVASFDWETYPVLKFSEVPEIDIELINTKDEVTARRRRSHRRANRGGDRQRRVACARRPHPRFAADARAHHGGAAEGIARARSRFLNHSLTAPRSFMATVSGSKRARGPGHHGSYRFQPVALPRH